MTLVLCAIDIAHIDDKSNVLAQASKLASLDDDALAVVTVLPDFGSSLVNSYFQEGAAEKAIDAARAKLHAVTKSTLGDDSNVQHVIRMGTAYEEILQAATELGASLIVMGSHKPNYQDYLLGPNAARVVRHAACSVYVLRE